MSRKRTPHGYTPATEFLHRCLRQDLGPIRLSIGREVWGKQNRYTVLIQTPRSKPHWIQLPQVTWSGAKVPSQDDLSSYEVSITECFTDDPHLSRRVKLRITGLDSIPGMSVPKSGMLWVDLDCRWRDEEIGYFPKNHPTLKEFQRRWKIEAAATLSVAARGRMKRLLAEGPYAIMG